MQIKFDSNQQYQLNAINSVVDIFDGQLHLDSTEIDTVVLPDRGSDLLQSGLTLFTNRLSLSNEQILSNLNNVQSSAGLIVSSERDLDANGLNFSVEMETGTGKTYVYLRSIFELNQKYGFKKFIIVVPNLAIREGVLKNLEITKKHFKEIYSIPTPDFFVYDGAKLNKVNDFANSESIQIMIINIQAFNKDTAVFNTDHYKLNGYSPREVISETRPIVIIDEPQIVDNTTKGKEAIASLKPLFILRYSATHRELYNQVHRLSPIDAFEQKLVKQIQVDDIKAENEFNNAYLKLVEIDNKGGIRAKVSIIKNLVEGSKKEDIWVKAGDNLFEKSNGREEYQNGYEIVEIMAGDEGWMEYTGGVLQLGDEIGGIKNELVRIQLKTLIKTHFDKMRQVDGRLKVLSLIFLDRVANYRLYDENNQATKGLYAQIFEEEYANYIKKFNPKNALPVDLVHDGYFSQDRGGKSKGVFKDTKGDAKDDADTYNKIMRDKEKLLSIEEPLQFIFTHSALGVGWDNPNVFQICTLNETNSTIKKRQEIGRGLRLPVDIYGERVRDENINVLTIITNESYTDFASKLQREFEEDCGIIFGLIKKDSFVGMLSKLSDEHGDGLESPDFGELEMGSTSIYEALEKSKVISNTGKIIKKDISESDILEYLPEEQKSNVSQIINRLQEISSIKTIIKPKVEPKVIKLKYTHGELAKLQEFADLWSKISQKTKYKIDFDVDEVMRQSIHILNDQLVSVSKVKISTTRAKVSNTREGVKTEEISKRSDNVAFKTDIPNLLTRLHKITQLKEESVAQLLAGHKYVNCIFDNPQEYMERASQIILDKLKEMYVNGVVYEKIEGDFWQMTKFQPTYEISHQNYVDVKHSIYDAIVYDNSNVEKNFALWCDQMSGENGNIKIFLKLPDWFKIPLPFGKNKNYNPDWALVYENDPDKLYLVRETKSTKKLSELRGVENFKINCAKKHFEAISNGNMQMFDVAIPNSRGGFDVV
jgi:type III restriction enzyme